MLHYRPLTCNNVDVYSGNWQYAPTRQKRHGTSLLVPVRTSCLLVRSSRLNLSSKTHSPPDANITKKEEENAHVKAKKSPTSQEKMTQPGAAKLIFCAAGIFVCYSYYAILQEKVTRGQYVDQSGTEKFTYMFALVFVQCVINCIFAKVLLMTVMKQGEDTTRTIYYFSCALTYLLAMVCSNMALQFVNYPTQVIGKAGKPIPVMILGVLLGGKHYPFKKYCFVTLIVTGVVLFMYKDKVATKQIEGEGFGQLLLLLSLIMDGLTSTVQERMNAEHKTKSGHMMFNMNVWSVVFSGIIILVSGEFLGFLKFLQRHPSAIQHILTLSICGALGQYFIFLTVAEFGPLTCSIATTTRKCFTVLASVVFFGNALQPRQWVATVVVFLGLFLDSFYGKTKTVKKELAK